MEQEFWNKSSASHESSISGALECSINKSAPAVFGGVFSVHRALYSVGGGVGAVRSRGVVGARDGVVVVVVGGVVIGW